MKCLCCQNVFDEKTNKKCPFCGFLVLHVVGDVDEQSEEIIRMVNEYKANMVRVSSVSLVTYEWSMGQGDSVQMAKESYIPFNIESGTNSVFWLDQEFARVERNKVELKIAIEKTDGSFQRRTVSVPVPNSKSFWRVGAGFYENNRMKIFIYSGNNISESDVISLL